MKLRFDRTLQRTVGVSFMLVVALVACVEKPPRQTRVSAVVYNYGQESSVGVRIGGEHLGGFDKVPLGKVSGGGVACCFSIQEGAKEVDVEVNLPDGQKYVAKASVEEWWFDLAHYGAVHILPGRKVVMQVTPSDPLPRKDLLEAQQQALGLPVKVDFRMWSAGPVKRLDGKL